MTRKKKITIFIIAIMALFIIITLYHFRFLVLGTSSATIRGKHNADFGIANIQSTVDKDGDGIDDQTDILKGARDYIATHPKYKSKYYGTGYSDDEYGVCTDVVGHALLAAGYDLMELVNEDILNHPEDYDIEKTDKKIDFRRVRNLNVYFSHTAIELTTDVRRKDQWQGGDIVIFPNHIGIVSDGRNRRGVPYVIHHANPYQAYYEEDILEKSAEIVGHYRVSEYERK